MTFYFISKKKENYGSRLLFRDFRFCNNSMLQIVRNDKLSKHLMENIKYHSDYLLLAQKLTHCKYVNMGSRTEGTNKSRKANNFALWQQNTIKLYKQGIHFSSTFFVKLKFLDFINFTS